MPSSPILQMTAGNSAKYKTYCLKHQGMDHTHKAWGKPTLKAPDMFFQPKRNRGQRWQPSQPLESERWSGKPVVGSLTFFEKALPEALKTFNHIHVRQTGVSLNKLSWHLASQKKKVYNVDVSSQPEWKIEALFRETTKPESHHSHSQWIDKQWSEVTHHMIKQGNKALSQEKA